ncbi:MAG: methyltransferase domain-containing protein [Euryarchaeota archaeon]|nr:methyltransferase domain-containing protein [Euryarchaeota archaeon]
MTVEIRTLGHERPRREGLHRWRVGHPPWDYRTIAKEKVAHASGLLDLGTGGGEFLASLAPLPARSFATEGYPPNLEVARRRLAPLGVRVDPIGKDNRIPLPDRSVDLVLSRHEEFDPNEVHRVLSAQGKFVTQQVGGRNCEELRERFGLQASKSTNDTSSVAALSGEVSGAGLRVERREEAILAYEFLDVGALVYFLRAVPWEVPGFSTSRHRAMLERIHGEIASRGSFRTTHHLMLVLAKRTR